MKKIIIVAAAAMAFSATAAFAITASSAAAPTNLKGFHATNGVTTSYIGNAALNAWAAVSAHKGGDKEYWTSSAFGGLAYKTVTPGSGNGGTAVDPPSTPTDSTASGSYTTM